MRKIFIVLIAVVLFFNLGLVNVKARDYKTTMRQDLLVMMMAYPENIKNIEVKEDKKIYLVTKEGKYILYDDMKVRSNDEKNSSGDIQDMLSVIYPLTNIDALMRIEEDPGRTRIYELLNEVYGASEQKVRASLIEVNAPYSKVLFNKNNGAATSFKTVMDELKELAKNNGKIATLINPINGTFNYRTISGTGRLSPHAYGIAVDLKSNPNDYWKWSKRDLGEKRMLWYPKELVEVFEKNNFIWGGKWGHFDILHFEYRPEIILKAKYFSKDYGNENTWYKGAPLDDWTISCIKIIEEATR